MLHLEKSGLTGHPTWMGCAAISVADLRVKGKWVCLYRAVDQTEWIDILKHIFSPVYRYRQLDAFFEACLRDASRGTWTVFPPEQGTCELAWSWPY